jgi:hypothetical protein
MVNKYLITQAKGAQRQAPRLFVLILSCLPLPCFLGESQRERSREKKNRSEILHLSLKMTKKPKSIFKLATEMEKEEGDN